MLIFGLCFVLYFYILANWPKTVYCMQPHYKSFNFNIFRKTEKYYSHYYLRVYTYTLIEFSKPSSGHSWVISTIHFGYMIPFDFVNFIHCDVSCKRYLLQGLLKYFSLKEKLKLVGMKGDEMIWMDKTKEKGRKKER